MMTSNSMDSRSISGSGSTTGAAVSVTTGASASTVVLSTTGA
ncbi:secreted protein [marine sediment metagenome]|uniref:Secreted protein n=1 Tax=marine sediment metagenome TaxID=412755 RepID=A0A1B6NRY1_9ZZZZ